jgi:hypothetical protein
LLLDGKRDGAVYLDLERPGDRRRLEDADAFLRAQAGKLVVIDEIHRAPALFETLRGVIDDRRAAKDRAGHFLLLGSAAIDLMRQASETSGWCVLPRFTFETAAWSMHCSIWKTGTRPLVTP